MRETKDFCYTLVDGTCYHKLTESYLKSSLEFGSNEAKMNALKEIIVSIANGEYDKSYLILIIRFILPMQDHTIKKLLLIFWEMYPKTGSDGELIKEMILVCDAFRKDLQHPNEYVRGATLRFLCKLKQPEILEPLVGSVRSCLNHRSPFVRRNAILSIYSIYKSYEYLVPDAPELIEDLLKKDCDNSCKRNAFIMLLNTDIDKAVSYLISALDLVPTFDQSLQIIIIELIQKICQKRSHEKSAFIRCIYTMLDSKSNAVRYEAARALIMLTNAPTALKATITCYTKIILQSSDNTTKLIVLDRLVEMKYRLPQKRILQECISDMLSLLTKNNDLTIKVKTMNLILDLITENNIEQVINILKKECSKNDTTNDYTNYKILLTQKLRDCYIKYPATAIEIVEFFTELLLLETDDKIVLNIINILKESTLKSDGTKSITVDKLRGSLSVLRSLEVYNKAVWVFVEFTDEVSDLSKIIDELYLVTTEMQDYMSKESKETVKKAVSRSTASTKNNHLHLNNDTQQDQNFRLITKPLLNDILNDTGFIATSIGWSITKAFLRYEKIKSVYEPENYGMKERVMYILTVLLQLNKSMKHSDSCNRLSNSLKLLCEPNKMIIDNYFIENNLVLSKVVINQERLDVENDKGIQVMQPDEPICMLHPMNQPLNEIIELDYMDCINNQEDKSKCMSERVLQLTGLSDPVYAETRMIHTSQQNITFLITLINRTDDILQNCAIELASSGDIVITDKPQPKIIQPGEQAEIQINVKVVLKGNSIIFGNISYDTTRKPQHFNVVLNDVSIHVIDYISPSDCSQDEFRKMWTDFEWENRVPLLPRKINDLMELLELVSKTLHMKCLTPKEAMMGKSCFLTANLHAVSIFGESVIANLSLEKNRGKIMGHIRLRSKSQGIVLGLGDIIRYLPC